MPKIESFQNGDVRGLRRVPVLWVLITTFVPVLLQKPVLLQLLPLLLQLLLPLLLQLLQLLLVLPLHSRSDISVDA